MAEKFNKFLHPVFLLILIVGSLFLRKINFTHLTLSIFSGLVLIYAFYVFDGFFKIKFGKKDYLFMILIALTGPILLIPLLQISPYADKFMHFIHPILLSSIVFFIVSKLKIKKLHTLFLVFFIVVASFAIFEIIEYSLDKTADYNVQGAYYRDITGIPISEPLLSPIDDTMIDLILDLFGALVYLVFGILRIRKS